MNPLLGAACPSCGAASALEVWTTQDQLARFVRLEFKCAACGWTYDVETTCASLQSVGDVAALLNQICGEAQPPGHPPLAPDTPSIEGSVIGYRAWRILDWQLAGTGVYRYWTPGVNEATCDAGGFINVVPPGTHAAPAAGCHCGLTALARFDDADAHWRNADVLGAIEAWSEDDAEGQAGRFFLHGTGFRAQFAKVVLLAIDPDAPAAKTAAIRALAREHGADVCRHEHLEDAAKEHGQLVPEDMLAQAARLRRRRVVAAPISFANGGVSTSGPHFANGGVSTSGPHFASGGVVPPPILLSKSMLDVTRSMLGVTRLRP